jgi:hypothetical protein
MRACILGLFFFASFGWHSCAGVGSLIVIWRHCSFSARVRGGFNSRFGLVRVVGWGCGGCGWEEGRGGEWCVDGLGGWF